MRHYDWSRSNVGYERRRDDDEVFFDLMWDSGLVESMLDFGAQAAEAVDKQRRQIEAENEHVAIHEDDGRTLTLEFPLAAARDVVEAAEHVEDHGCPDSSRALHQWVMGELAPALLERMWQEGLL